MLDLPMAVSKNVYTTLIQVTTTQAKLQAEESMTQAREQVCKLYWSESDGDVIDLLVSCDGTRQHRGFSSLFGAVFTIAYGTGKVIDFIVKLKFYKGYKHWKKQDKTSEAS